MACFATAVHNRAPVFFDPGGKQSFEALARAGLEAARELAMSVAPCEGAAGEGKALDEESRWNDDATDLQVVDDGAHDRLASLCPDRGRGACRDRDAVIGLTDRAQVKMEDDLACVLPTRLIPPGVEIEDAWLDPELLGGDLYDCGRQLLVAPQGSPEVMHEGELHREAEPVVLSTMLPRKGDVLRCERVAALNLVVIGRWIKKRGAQLW